MLRRSNWQVALFSDLQVEKECRIRRRLATVFNQREEDFESLRAYDDWLEEVEEIVFGLLHDRDVQATEAKLDAYRQQHSEEIARREERAKEETLKISHQQEREKHQREEYEMELLAEMEADDLAKEQQSRAAVEELLEGTSRRKKQNVAVQRPSFKGLRLKVKQDAELERTLFDPFDTVPAIQLPMEFRMEIIHPELQLYSKASPFVPNDLLIMQSAIAALTWGIRSL